MFGFIKKGLGKLAKGVASKLTMGASDHVLKALKSLGTAKRVLSTRRRTSAAEAQMLKYGVPRVRQSTVIGMAAAGAGTPGTYGRRKATSRRRASPEPAYDDELPAPRPRRRARRKKAASVSRRPATRTPTRRRRATGTGARRRPPPGGLDFRAMSAEWKAAGKPGTWQEWIRSNPRRNP